MRSNSKHSVEELERYIKMYLEQGVSHRELIDRYGLLLSGTAFRSKVLKYQEHGIAGIQTRSRNNHYSKQFKEFIVKEHIGNGVPIRELARKYNIPAHETVRTWSIKYTKGEGIKTKSTKPEDEIRKSKNITEVIMKMFEDVLLRILREKE